MFHLTLFKQKIEQKTKNAYEHLTKRITDRNAR